MQKFQDPGVEKVFAGFPAPERQNLLLIRTRIFNIAKQTSRIGPVTEALRWGQPAYLTLDSRSGSTIRLGVLKQGGYAVFTHCQTKIMADFKHAAPDLAFDGNRAVHFQASQSPPDILDFLIHRALVYHL